MTPTADESQEYRVRDTGRSFLPVVIDEATKSFGRRMLWSGVDFTVNGGEMVSLVGPSGSGKTTLLNCLGLLEELDRGRVVYGSVEARRSSVRRMLYRDAIGFLFQNSGLVDSWTVRENLQVAFHGRRISRATKQHEIAAALERLGLGGTQDDRVYTLSGGEQQRVGLARLLLRRAEVVLADEPTASLDSENAELVIRTLRGLADAGAAVVISTHDDQVVCASDRVVRLGAG